MSNSSSAKFNQVPHTNTFLRKSALNAPSIAPPGQQQPDQAANRQPPPSTSNDVWGLLSQLLETIVQEQVTKALQSQQETAQMDEPAQTDVEQASQGPSVQDPFFTASAAAYSGEKQQFGESHPLPDIFFFTPEWRALNEGIEHCKAAFFDLSHEVQNDLHAENEDKLQKKCYAILDALNLQLQEAERLLDMSSHKEEGWGYIFKEIYPFFMRSRFAERSYFKPKGYAGDFLMIEMLYHNQADGDGRLGKMVDSWCLDTATARAVRGRRKLLKQLIEKFSDARKESPDPIRIMNLGCGANRELFDFLKTCDYSEKIEATCVDTDKDALVFTNQRVNRFYHRASIRLLDDNVARWSVGRSKYRYNQQDIIYSSGLTDYFGTRTFRALATRSYDHLKPGGVLIIGNFGPANPHKTFMDSIIRWKLIHRSEEELLELFTETPFQSRVKVVSEPESINLFAIAHKPTD